MTTDNSVTCRPRPFQRFFLTSDVDVGKGSSLRMRMANDFRRMILRKGTRCSKYRPVLVGSPERSQDDDPYARCHHRHDVYCIVPNKEIRLGEFTIERHIRLTFDSEGSKGAENQVSSLNESL